VCMNFDDFVKQPKRVGYKKAKFWVKCLDCRAIYSDRVFRDYPDCKFCGGANWSNSY